MVPFTCGHVTPIADPAIGLAPTFPLIPPPPVLVIPAPERIANGAVERRSTGAGPAAKTSLPIARASKRGVRYRPFVSLLDTASVFFGCWVFISLGRRVDAAHSLAYGVFYVAVLRGAGIQ